MIVQEDIVSILKQACGKIGVGAERLSVTFSNLPEKCDFQSNFCFMVAKELKISPYELAENIVKNIKNNKKFEFFAEKPGFINIILKDDYLSMLANDLLKLEKV